MKRRNFGLLAGASVAAITAAGGRAGAQAAAPAQLLKTTLTPLGGERGANADGSIPAWTGGYTTVPAGWTPRQEMPDFFASDALVVKIDSGNMAQYSSQLTDGVRFMMQNYGFSIEVYPTHRTMSAPQYVYDNTALNAGRSTLDPRGGRFGFNNGYGGVPFPIPSTTDPLAAGAQIMWNHNARWQGYIQHTIGQTFVVSSGQQPVITTVTTQNYVYPYFDPNGSLEQFHGVLYMAHVDDIAPATSIGTQVIQYDNIDSLDRPNIAWELLAGQGRVRKTPILQYDTPSIFAAGLVNYDQYYGFQGALNLYDWKLLGKQEMFIPYNNNKLRFINSNEAFGPKFINPDAVRWERHRVWVVDATLHPGERNVLAHRRFYIDEDTWSVVIADAWDSNGNLFREDMTFNLVRPDIPCTVNLYTLNYNFTSGDYAMVIGAFNDPAYYKPLDFSTPFSNGEFDPNLMAAQASY